MTDAPQIGGLPTAARVPSISPRRHPEADSRTAVRRHRELPIAACQICANGRFRLTTA